MLTALLVMGGFSALELLMWSPLLWPLRKALATSLLCALATVSGLLIALHINGITLLITIGTMYRVINLLRVIQGRMQADYLYRVTRRTSQWLIGLEAAGVAICAGLGTLHAEVWLIWAAVMAQIFVTTVLLYSTLRTSHKVSAPILDDSIAERDLPSLTVAIPARNETEDLQLCLESLIASSYPKLEIIVLDDCSQNKNTPEIIRSFAHEGVRFIAGEEPPKHWLAKNYAYDQLVREANSNVILFCGVDVRFERGSLTAIVKTMLQKQKSMLCVMPRNTLPAKSPLLSFIVQTSRYAWELAIPRRWLNRPPVLSTCWLITRDVLESAGGFPAVRRGVLQERYFARYAAVHHDGYSFIRSDEHLGVSTNKDVNEQQATAIRTRYPQLHRRPELVALVSLAELCVLVWPLALTLLAITVAAWPLAIASGLGYLLICSIYAVVAEQTYHRLTLRGLLLAPIAAIYDIALLNYSMWQYEFREVVWKGRNICMPVMRVTPHLPPLPKR